MKVHCKATGKKALLSKQTSFRSF